MLLERLRGAFLFGILDLAVAAIVGAGVFGGLPARWAPVDIGAIAFVGMQLASAVALLAGLRVAPIVARITAVVSLAAGLSLVSALALTASWLSGVYGPIGRGGAVLYFLI